MSWSQLVLISALLGSCLAKPSFILTGPKLYDKGTNETLTVTFFGIQQKGQVQVKLLSSPFLSTNEKHVLSEVAVDVENDQTKTIELPVPLKIPDDVANGALEITGSVGDYTVNRTVSIGFRDPITIVFVNTDKPIYKAEQTVRIRVLVTDSNLRPSNLGKEGEIWITDTKRTRIAQWLNVSFAEGLVHREMPLPEEPLLGLWKIHVKINNTMHTRTFKVLEYVLPPFEVKVTPPPYVLQNAKNATWKICAKYTYGKPVRGELVTKLSNTRQYWQKEKYVIENNTEINGCKDVILPVEEIFKGNGYYYYRGIELQAEVTEEGTGTKINSTGRVNPTNVPYTISREDSDIQYFRSGIPLRITMSVKTPDSKPLSNETIKVCISVVREKWSKIRTLKENLNVCKNYTSNQHGFVIFTIPPQDAITVYIKVEVEAAKFESKDHQMQRPKHSFKLTPWFSPSGGHLQLEKLPKIDCSAIGPDVKITQRFHYTFDEPGSKKIYYQIMARGEIIKHGDFEITLKADNKNTTDDTYLPIHPKAICSGDKYQWDNDNFKSSKYVGQFIYSMQLSHEMIPKARVLMYTVTKGGDVVADSTWYNIDPCFANKVEMKFGEEKQSPGSKVTVYVMAEPKSLCSIGIVDKSVYILDKGDILTASQVSNKLGVLDTSGNTPPYQPTPHYEYCQKKDNDRREGHYDATISYVDAITAFDSAGGIVLTDLELETRPCKKSTDVDGCFRPPIRTPTRVMHRPLATSSFSVSNKRPAIAFEGASNRVGISDVRTEVSPAITVRTNFPDTWLFQLDRVGDKGELVFKQDMPDSITEWEGAAVCVHPEKGLGLSKTASIIAFQPFFASLTLPYSVIRNETVPIIVTVFNYLKDCLPIKVRLDQTEDFILYNGTSTRDICVCGEQSTTIRFHIQPVSLGQLNTTVTAETSNEKDICGNYDIATNVKRSDTITKPVLVEAEGFLKEETTNNFFCLEDTEGGIFKSNHLLQLPDDAIRDSVRAYFSFTGDLMGPALEGLDRLVRLPTGCGEQNMIGLVPNIVVLDYLNATGRLTEKLKQKAINNIRQGYMRQQKYRHPDGSYSAFGREKEGSMWLTAFVVKTFSSARRYINIDEDSLRVSRNWILSRQKDNGCFPMVGTVHNKAMKGGVAKDETNSALTAYILISMLESGSANTSMVEGSIQCLGAKNKPSNYSLALFAYAASLANDPSAASYLQQLIDGAEVEDANIYWKNSDKSIAVETAAYAILALLKLNRDNDFQTAASIVRWLTMQRNPYGGFHSTQDTVVGLQALGKYGALINMQQLDMDLSVKTDRIDEVFQLNEENRLLTQRINLRLEDEPEAEVKVEATGSGCALVQILLRYNLPNPEPSNDFEMSVKTEKSKDNCKKATIHICVSYNHENGSNMAIIEVKMVSGYVPVKSTVEELLLKNTDLEIRRYEIKENKVNLYFTTLTEKIRCFSFDALQEIEVLDAKAAGAKVYDYYDNEKVVSVPYTIEETCLS